MYERFVQLLTELNVTAYRVSKDTGVSQSTISGWKDGREPRPITLKIIADYFGVSVAYLKGETDDRGQKEKPTGNADELTNEEMKFIEWFRNEASEKDKALVRMIVEGDK